MNNNTVHLAALIKDSNKYMLLHMPMHQSLQDEMYSTWSQQYHSFAKEVVSIDFDASYRPEDGECFQLIGYELPQCLRNVNVRNLEPMVKLEKYLNSIVSIVCFFKDDEDEVLLFKKFNRSHIIHPKTSFFMQNGTYSSYDKPGIFLDKKLSAVYFIKEQKLYFNSFKIVNVFLPLMDFYREASETDIRELLNHPKIFAQNVEVIIEESNQWLQRRFAMLRDSGVLDTVSVQQVSSICESYGMEISIIEDRIVFPSDKSSLRRLLQFLNEEIFRGAITDTLYATNSKYVTS